MPSRPSALCPSVWRGLPSQCACLPACPLSTTTPRRSWWWAPDASPALIPAASTLWDCHLPLLTTHLHPSAWPAPRLPHASLICRLTTSPQPLPLHLLLPPLLPGTAILILSSTHSPSPLLLLTPRPHPLITACPCPHRAPRLPRLFLYTYRCSIWDTRTSAPGTRKTTTTAHFSQHHNYSCHIWKKRLIEWINISKSPLAVKVILLFIHFMSLIPFGG